jgi:hypothetical protein
LLLGRANPYICGLTVFLVRQTGRRRFFHGVLCIDVGLPAQASSLSDARDFPALPSTTGSDRAAGGKQAPRSSARGTQERKQRASGSFFQYRK